MDLINLAAIGYQQIVNVSASVGLTVPVRARVALIQAETRSVRWRDDGVAPTASIGMVLNEGATLMYDGALSSIRFIEIAASAKLNVSYYE